MFGTSVHFLQSPAQLIVIGPIDLWLLLTLSLFTLVPLIFLLSRRPLQRTQIKAAIFMAVITFLVFGLVPSGSRLTLNRTSNSATLSRYFFYHWHTTTFPLSDLDNASVRTGSGTSQILLQYTNGAVTTLSERNQESGKDEAVYAINKFLGRK